MTGELPDDVKATLPILDQPQTPTTAKLKPTRTMDDIALPIRAPGADDVQQTLSILDGKQPEIIAPDEPSKRDVEADVLKLALRKGVNSNTALAAHRKAVAQKIGVSPALVTPQAEESAFYQDHDPVDLQKNYPALAKYLKVEGNAELVGKNVDQLKGVETFYRRAVQDPEIMLSKGVIGAAQTLVGLGDLVSLGKAGKYVEEKGLDLKKIQSVLTDLYTPETQAALKSVSEAKGFWGTLEAAGKNPSSVGIMIGESLPQMYLGRVFGGALIAAFPSLSFGTAGAIGEGITMAGGSAEQIRRESDTGELSAKQTALALGVGVLGTGLSAVGNKIATKLGIEDVDAALVAGKLLTRLEDSGMPKQLAVRLIGGAAVEGGVEEMPQSIVEQIAQNVALNRPWDEGVPENAALGLVTGGAMGTAVQLGAVRGKTPITETPAEKQARATVQNSILRTAAAVNAEEQRNALKEWGKRVAQDTTLRKESPESFKDFVRTMADEDGAVKEVFVDAKLLNETLAQAGISKDKLVEDMPEVAASLVEALDTNGEVRIPIEDYATHIVGTPVEQGILDHLRTTPDGMTYVESQQFFQQQQDDFITQAETLVNLNEPVLTRKEFAAQAPEGVQYKDYLAAHKNKVEVFASDLKEVHDKLLTGLESTGKFPKSISRVYAIPFREFYATNAARMGILPSELYDSLPLNFAKMQTADILAPTSGTLSQDDYRGQHTAPGRNGGAPLHDLTGGGEVYPDDIYSRQQIQYYGTGEDALDRQTFALVNKYKGKPDAVVTVYRAVPKSAGDEINPGDWVTINKKYATDHGKNILGGDYKLITKKVKASEVFTNGDSIHEYGYDPGGVLAQAAKLPETVNVDGVERPTMNSNGKPIYPTEEGIRNFWKWFGDSKVVDDQGRPLVVYHGTGKDVPVFNTKGGEGKTYGTGVFFSSNPATSSTYTQGVNGGNVSPVYLKLETPGEFDAKGANWNRLNKNTRVRLPATTVSMQEDENLLAELEGREPTAGAQRRLKARDTTLGRLLPNDFKYVDDYASTDDIARWTRQQGYDGVVISNVKDQGPTGNFVTEESGKPGGIYVAFSPNQIKSAIGNNGDFSNDPNILKQSAFYSALEREVPNLRKVAGKDGSIKTDQAKAWIEARQKEGKFKKEEVEAVGLLDWLDAQEGKVPVADIENFVRENGVQVQETLLGGTALPIAVQEYEDQPEIYTLYRSDDPEGQSYGSLGEIIKQDDGQYEINVPGFTGRVTFDSLQEALERVSRGSSQFSETKFDNYVLPGGKNYRELLLTLPDKDGQAFNSAHFDQPNILAHVRVDERTVGDQRVLFVEEIQSDWAQQGRDKGFAKNETKQWFIARKGGATIGPAYARREDAQAAMHLDSFPDRVNEFEVREENKQNGVPTGPFVQNTKSWTALAVKRLLRYAAENGFDKIAWTTGEQQAARYDLSKQISEVHYSGTNLKAYDYDGNTVMNQTGVREEDLPDYIGKEAAQKLIDQPKRGTLRSLEGLDLKIGGEGMKAFYDQIVPQVVNEVSKKLGGGKVDVTDFRETFEQYMTRRKLFVNPADGAVYASQSFDPRTRTVGSLSDIRKQFEANRPESDLEKQHSLDITPEMRDKIMQGLPLFQGQRAGFDPSTFTMSLLKGADLSSVIHEGAHFYLEALADLAGRENAPQQIKDDFRATLDWFGITGNEAGTPGGDLLEQRAFHGSPHDHNKFDSAKIGTGEGAQAYGYGHYFTDTKAVAEHYTKGHRTNVLALPNGEVLPEATTGSGEKFAQTLLKANAGDYGKALKENKVGGEALPGDVRFSKAVEKILKDYRKRGIATKAKTGGVYEVELAPEQDEYLLWDKPLSEQSEKVKAALGYAQANVTFKESAPYGPMRDQSWLASNDWKIVRDAANKFDVYDSDGGFNGSKGSLIEAESHVKQLSGTNTGGTGELLYKDTVSNLTNKYVISEQRVIKRGNLEGGRPTIEYARKYSYGVYDNVKQAKAEFMRKLDSDLRNAHNDYAAKHFDQQMRNGGAYKVEKINNPKQAASEYLHSLGIRGIKYLDGSSRAKGEGAYNYVIFDDRDITIAQKYAQSARIPPREDAIVSGEGANRVTLYHGTNTENYTRITEGNKLNGPVFFTPRKEIAADYGDRESIVTVSIPKEFLKIDFDLPGGELLSVEEANGYNDTEGFDIDDYLNVGQSVGVEQDVYLKQPPSSSTSVLEQGGETPPPGQLPPTITVDGVERPTMNSGGRPIYPTEEGIRNFWRWFGDSKVVDEKGRPKVMYHGTHGDFDTFEVNEALGGAIFLAPDAGYAGNFAYAKGANTRPVYVRVVNPRRGVMPARDEARLLPKARSRGQDGVYVHDSSGDENNLAVFNPDQIKSAIGNSGDFSNDPNTLKQGGETPPPGQLPPGRTPEEIWNSMTLDQKRPYHEQWAQSYERYTLEGKAPTVEMQSVFARFREWMLSVYKSMKDFLAQNPLAGKLNDDIRGVFDRLIASEEKIYQAEEARGYTALFTSAAEAGLSEAEYEDYTNLGKLASTRALDEMQGRSIRDMRWLSNAKDKTIKKLQAEANSKRAAITKQVADEVDDMPLNRARNFLAKGEFIDESGVHRESETKFKLNAEEVKALTNGQVPANIKNMVAPDGIGLELAAKLLGFQSPETLVDELVNGESRDVTIQGLTDQRMLEQYGDLTDDKAIERAAEKAIHNDARARFMATGLKLLSKTELSVAQLNRAAKMAAETTIGKKKIRAITPGQFTRAEAKANREALENVARDPKKAIDAQRAALLNNRLAKAALEAAEDVDSILKYFKKFESKGVRKAVGIDQIDQIDDLLQSVDRDKNLPLREIDKRQALADWVAEQEADGFEPVLDPVLAEQIKTKHYKDMTITELRNLRDTVKQIEHVGRLKQTLLTEMGRADFRTRVEEAENSIRENANRTVEEHATPTDTIGIAGQWVRQMLASHRKFNSFLREMDGGRDGGVMWRLLAKQMNAAGDNEVEMRRASSEAISGLFNGFKQDKTPLNLYAKRTRIPGTDIAMTQEQRIMFGMNWGNEGNRQRLLDGGIAGKRALSINDAEAILDTLTKEEWDFIQGTWDHIATYKDRIAALERKITGIEPEWIAPAEIKTKYGTYRGGYFPAKYDTELSTRSESLEAAVDLRMGMKGAFNAAAARNGYTKQRSEAVMNRPLMLSYNVIANHISEVTHRLAWQPWLIDANRLLKALDAPIRQHYGAEVLREMRNTVTDIAAGDAGARGAMERAINHLRTGSTIVGMGWRFSTAFLQPSGLAQSWARIGGRWMAKGIAETFKNLNSAGELVNGKSSLMKNRDITMNREVRDVLDRVRTTDSLNAVTGSYFSLIGKMQRVVDIPTWLGAYEKALHDMQLENATTEEERARIDSDAVALADQAVIDSQSGGQLKDLASIQRGSPALKLFTNFYSYFSATYNLNVEALRRTNFRSPTDVALLAGDLVLLNIIPVIFSLALKEMTKGKCGDDLECLTKSYGYEQLGYMFGQMILLRDMGSAALVAAGSDQYGYSGPAGLRFFSDLYKAGVQVNQGELDWPLFKSISNTTGVVLHFPTGQINTTLEGILAVENGDVEGVSILPALLFGPPKDN